MTLTTLSLMGLFLTAAANAPVEADEALRQKAYACVGVTTHALQGQDLTAPKRAEIVAKRALWLKLPVWDGYNTPVVVLAEDAAITMIDMPVKERKRLLRQCLKDAPL